VAVYSFAFGATYSVAEMEALEAKLAALGGCAAIGYWPAGRREAR
jgi:hypothetical protein